MHRDHLFVALTELDLPTDTAIRDYIVTVRPNTP